MAVDIHLSQHFLVGKIYEWSSEQGDVYWVMSDEQFVKGFYIECNSRVVILDYEEYRNNVVMRILTESGSTGWIRVDRSYFNDWTQVTQ